MDRKLDMEMTGLKIFKDFKIFAVVSLKRNLNIFKLFIAKYTTTKKAISTFFGIIFQMLFTFLKALHADVPTHPTKKQKNKKYSRKKL